MEMLNPFKFKKDKQTDRQHVLLKRTKTLGLADTVRSGYKKEKI